MAAYVNPDYVDLLEAFDFGRYFVWAKGSKLRDEEGREYVDFLAGFGVHNIGHNHPRLVQRLKEALDSGRPSMLNIDASLLIGLLAQKLNDITHPSLCRTVFANSGAETVETAIKTARAATGRSTIVSCQGAWHGLTTGALSLMDDEQHKGFGPLLNDVVRIPFGDLEALEKVCKQYRPAAFFVEPIQGEGGIRFPSADYLKSASEICRKSDCLLVVDEIQTGLGRTGTLFSTIIDDVLPDIFLVGKALSGGMVPVAACLMTAKTWSRGFAGPRRCNLCASTFAGGHLAMVAGLETLDIVQEENLCGRACELGDYLLDELRKLANRHAIIREVRGKGLFIGVEFQPAAGFLPKVMPAWARKQIFSQIVCAVLIRDYGIITQTCGLAPTVLRIEPPLVISKDNIDYLIHSLDKVLKEYPTYNMASVAAIRKTVLGKTLMFLKERLKVIWASLKYRESWTFRPRQSWGLLKYLMHTRPSWRGSLAELNAYCPPIGSKTYGRYLHGLKRICRQDWTPLVAHVSVTDRCPYRCERCSNVSKSDKDPELSTLKQLFRELVSAGTSRVCLTGGEPTCARTLCTLSMLAGLCRRSFSPREMN